jgi:hypothetical protein
MFSKYEIFLLQKTNHELFEKDFDIAEIPRYAYFEYPRWVSVPQNYFTLKVHKNENFVGFDFEFCTISLLFMSKY